MTSFYISFLDVLALGDMPENMGDKNHRDRWSSLTELQYDRLAKWAQGSFNPGKRPLSGTAVEQEVARLTLATLKWTTGAPLFPGIEMYWVAEFSSMYNLYPKPLDTHKPDTRFRFHNSVLPGDLTKGLSLPWQADFYMCVHSFNITNDLIDIFLYSSCQPTGVSQHHPSFESINCNTLYFRQYALVRGPLWLVVESLSYQKFLDVKVALRST